MNAPHEVDHPSSQVAKFGADQPLRLDCGVDFSPFQIAYQTYGELNADRTNAVLICHCADRRPARRQRASRSPASPAGGDTLVGPGRPLDPERYFIICANVIGGCTGLDGPGLDQSRDRQGVGPGFSGHHHSRHGARAGDADRPARYRHAVLRWSAARWAACRCCNGPRPIRSACSRRWRSPARRATRRRTSPSMSLAVRR